MNYLHVFSSHDIKSEDAWDDFQYFSQDVVMVEHPAMETSDNDNVLMKSIKMDTSVRGENT